MNETLKVIEKRSTCRSYNGQMPPQEMLEAIAKAAVQAPSALNGQPWRVIVVKNKALIDEIENDVLRIMKAMADQTGYQRIMSRGGKPFYNTPCMIFVPFDPKAFRGGAFDCGIIIQNIALAAASLGLDNCICASAGTALMGDRGSEFKAKLGFPEGYEYGLAVMVGYGAAAPASPHEPDMAKISYID